MAFAVIASVITLIAAYFLVPLALERMGLIRLREPPGGWRRKDEAGSGDPAAGQEPPVRGRGGDFGGGGASGDW